MKKIFTVALLTITFLSLNNITKAEEKVCTMQYDPVCGVDGVTYGNSCMANDVKKAYDGECKEKISGPSQIKFYRNIVKYGKDLFGDRLEKISGPSQIKFYKNIVKGENGKDLYGYKKSEKEIQDLVYKIIKNSKSECVTGGQTTINNIINSGEDFLRFEGTTTKKGCGFACDYNLKTNTISSGWMCTGLISK